MFCPPPLPVTARRARWRRSPFVLLRLKPKRLEALLSRPPHVWRVPRLIRWPGLIPGLQRGRRLRTVCKRSSAIVHLLDCYLPMLVLGWISRQHVCRFIVTLLVLLFFLILSRRCFPDRGGGHRPGDHRAARQAAPTAGPGTKCQIRPAPGFVGRHEKAVKALFGDFFQFFTWFADFVRLLSFPSHVLKFLVAYL